MYRRCSISICHECSIHFLFTSCSIHFPFVEFINLDILLSLQAQQQQQRPPPPRTRMANPAPPPVPTPSAPPMPPQPAQVPPTPPRMQAQDKGPVPVVPPGAVLPPVQPQPASGLGAVASNGSVNTEEMLVDQSGPSASNMPPRPTMPEDEETLIQEAIRLTRGRLRRRMAGSGGPPSN
jgi:receptor expression-enhancing protein 1/2/3/4